MTCLTWKKPINTDYVLWGLHIMDLQTREDTHHPILIFFAIIASIGAFLGCMLMFRRRKGGEHRVIGFHAIEQQLDFIARFGFRSMTGYRARHVPSIAR